MLVSVCVEGRADPVDIAQKMPACSRQKLRAARQLAARMLGQREAVLLGRHDQLDRRQQRGRTVMMPVLDPRADTITSIRAQPRNASTATEAK